MDSIVRNHLEYLEDEEGVHLSFRPQRAGLIAEETLPKIPIKYIDFADLFFLELASELLKHIGVNNYAIELVDTNRFIRPSKSPAGAPIFFDWKLDGSLVLIIEALIIFPAILVLMAMIGLTLQDKLGKI